MLNESSLNQIEDYDSMDIDDLYLVLGKTLGQAAAFPMPKSEIIRQARKWIESYRKEFIDSICNNSNIKEIFLENGASNRRATLIATIADVISGIVSGIPPFMVSVIIVKEGLHSLCNGTWIDE